jgi:hypothetical protein
LPAVWADGRAFLCQLDALRVGDDDQPNGHTVYVPRRYVRGRLRLDEPFLVFGPYCDNDLVSGEGRQCVSDRQFDLGFPSTSLHRLARKLLGRTLGYLLGVTKGALVVREPVEDALPDDGHHDLDLVCVADLGAQGRFCVFDRADDENASHSAAIRIRVVHAVATSYCFPLIRAAAARTRGKMLDRARVELVATVRAAVGAGGDVASYRCWISHDTWRSPAP